MKASGSTRARPKSRQSDGPAKGRPTNDVSTAKLRAWLEEAAACLVDASREVPAPPSPDLQTTYDAVCSSRQQIEQSRRDLIESIQVQSLHTVGSILAHDLHNLSLRLSLLSQNLEQFYGEPAFLQSAQRVLDDTVERMQGLVDGFRQRQETIIIKIPTDVNDVLRALIRQLQVDSMPEIELVEAYGDPPMIWADSFFLANAFRVLIENALDAMDRRGRLTLCTGMTHDGRVGLEIEDTGRGMSREFIARELFAPFRSSSGGRGLGLGMYICQHIIQLHQGDIDVYSEQGRGTRFRLTFPVEHTST